MWRMTTSRLLTGGSTRRKVYFGVVSVCMCNNMSTKLELYTETCAIADSAAAVETLRAELARAKEQPWMSNLAANKATDELKAEQAATYMATAQATEVVCLKQKLDAADDDIMLINKRLDAENCILRIVCFLGQSVYISMIRRA